MTTRDEVKRSVLGILSAVAHVPVERIEEKDRLEKDLGLTKLIRKALGISYSKVTDDYEEGTRVPLKEAEGYKTVKETIDKVTKHAQGEI